jgi:hypothetical protein
MDNSKTDIATYSECLTSGSVPWGPVDLLEYTDNERRFLLGVNRLAEWIKNSKHVVFHTGAGMLFLSERVHFSIKKQREGKRIFVPCRERDFSRHEDAHGPSCELTQLSSLRIGISTSCGIRDFRGPNGMIFVFNEFRKNFWFLLRFAQAMLMMLQLIST